MKDDNDILRDAISGLFDIQAEPDKVVVTAPTSLCNDFYRYMEEHHAESRKVMCRPLLEIGQEIHFGNCSTDQVVEWVHEFADQLDTAAVSECYRAIYP
ncbi:MAG: hypothetical protein JNN07_17020 [Verrucomicrobiales bacterium]|nr:hypothetical protein [Verrucomicrobiales bacterium]